MAFRIRTFEDYQSEYRKSVERPEAFWEEKANEFVWKQKWEQVVSWNFAEPDVRWFTNGKLNITENCLDRHLSSIGDQAAIIWEPNNPDETIRKLTYSELHKEVC